MVLYSCNTIERDYQRLAVATLVVSAAAVVGVKVYNYYSMPELMRANLEALTSTESVITTWNCVGGIGVCSASCGKCGTTVRGKGTLTGIHNCE